MINIKSQYNSYNLLGTYLHQYQKKISGISVKNEIPPFFSAGKYSFSIQNSVKDEYYTNDYNIFYNRQNNNNDNEVNLLEFENCYLKLIAKRFQILKKNKIVLQPQLKDKFTFKIETGQYVEPDNSEGNIKGFHFICQKNCFIEIDLNFISEEVKIESVGNLPQGLVFENGKIKGTPLNSGIDTIELNTNDGNMISCILEVPNLIRLL